MVEQHAQAARALGEEGGELPWAVDVSRCAHHLPTDNFGIGSKYSEPLLLELEEVPQN